MAIRALLTMLLGVFALASQPAWAQDPAANFPNKPIRVIIGFAAGGGNDLFARVVGQKLSEILKQPVVIENKPGAGGRLSAEFVAAQSHLPGIRSGFYRLAARTPRHKSAIPDGYPAYRGGCNSPILGHTGTDRGVPIGCLG